VIFKKFREFRAINNTLKYLEIDLALNFKDLFNGLRHLNFDENFVSFKITVTVPGSSELAIRNQLDSIPSGKIILKDNGTNAIVDGVSPWNKDFVYLQNLSASPKTVTVLFLQ
jgi:hypothetical protein